MTAPPAPAAGLSTASLQVRVSADRHLRLDLDLLRTQDPLLKTPSARAFPIELVIADRHLIGDDFEVISLFSTEDALVATCAAEEIEVRLSFRAGPVGSIHMLVQLRAATVGEPCNAELRLPIVEYLHPGDLTSPPHRDPGRGPLGPDGEVLVRGGGYPLPYSCRSETAGVAVMARYARDPLDAGNWHSPPEALPVRLRSEWLDACELVFVACEPCWPGAFQALRSLLRSGVDLSEYRRNDLGWYRRQWLQHFTFLYGGEIFDHTMQRFDLNRLLDDGRRFGCYDAILLWPQYPRIGVDERDQWAFYDDLPSGRSGMRALVEQAQTCGVRVFIPYLPWDVSPEVRHGDAPRAAIEMARAVADLGADGVFLDTMATIHPQFRREIDRVRPGVVFCSENRPGLGAISTVTGSWDQGEHNRAGEVDLQRFLFPEHPSFMINRSATGARRERVTSRALFNGAGLVVWQDVFGEALPYSAGQATHIRVAVGILRRYEDRFRGVNALPLVPVAREGLLANAFIAEDGRAVVTIYNGAPEQVSGDLVAWSHDAQQVWTRVTEEGSAGDVSELPRGTLAPGEVAVYASSTHT